VADADAPRLQAAPLVTVKVLLLIEPMPRRAQDEFTLRARSLTDGFEISEPIVVAQRPLYGGQYLGLQLRVFPTPRTVRSSSQPVKTGSTRSLHASPSEALDVLITISPMPRRRADSFDLIALCLTRRFQVDVASIGQYPAHGGQSVTLSVRVYPEKPTERRRRWDDGWPESAEEFGRAVWHARTSLELSKAALAKLTGITDVTLCRIEGGGIPSPPTRTALIQALSKAGAIRQ
jgi:hypothetical protein